MHKPIKYVEKGMTYVANAAWQVFDRLNAINRNPGFTPQWSDKPLLKSWQKVKPPLGWPRETDSLCPVCVREARQEILDGRKPVSDLLSEKVGEIKAQIIERDGKILMVKDCPIHGHFEDVMAIDTAFFKHLEESFPGSDIRAHNDEKLHNHGSSTIKYGRGSVLTIDLTNRCNMMCDPCFMDANQVGFVHELTWDDIKQILDNAITIKPRRQMSVQFSGGEPTMSPYFLDAIRYSRKVGYNSVQAATNGIEFAKSVEFAKAAAEAGLRYAYLQFDGIGNAANSHRRVGNLFDVKLRAIEPIADVVLADPTSISIDGSTLHRLMTTQAKPAIPLKTVLVPVDVRKVIPSSPQIGVSQVAKLPDQFLIADIGRNIEGAPWCFVYPDRPDQMIAGHGERTIVGFQRLDRPIGHPNLDQRWYRCS